MCLIMHIMFEQYSQAVLLDPPPLYHDPLAAQPETVHFPTVKGYLTAFFGGKLSTYIAKGKNFFRGFFIFFLRMRDNTML